MDVEILPEPSDEERQAVVQALRLEAEEQHGPTPWQRVALQPTDEAYATAPRRQRRGATRA